MDNSDTPRAFEILGVVREGVAVVRQSELKAATVALGDGTPFIMTLTEDLPFVRSQKASKYYQAIVVRAGAKATGNSVEMVHRGWKAMFLPDADMFTDFFNWFAGQEAIPRSKRPLTTRDLPIRDFYDYVEECREWLRTEYQVDTPDPDPLFFKRRARG